MSAQTRKIKKNINKILVSNSEMCRDCANLEQQYDKFKVINGEKVILKNCRKKRKWVTLFNFELNRKGKECFEQCQTKS
jgi:hypothetical protein